MFIKLSHLAILVNDIKEAKKLWTEAYGFKVTLERTVEVEGVKIAILPIGDSFIELVEPIDHGDMSNMKASILATKGEGIYQIAFAVEDTAQEAKKLAEKGITYIKRPPAWAGAKERLLVPSKLANGIMFEIYSESDISEGMSREIKALSLNDSNK